MFRFAIANLGVVLGLAACGCEPAATRPVAPALAAGSPAAQQTEQSVDECSDVSGLVDKLDYDVADNQGRAAADQAYRRLYTRRKTCAPALVEAIVSRRLGRMGQESLEKLVHEAGAAAIPPLLSVLKSSSPGSFGWHVAVNTLAGYGPGAAPLLEARLSAESPSVRRGVLEALIAMGQPSVPALVAALDDPSREIRHRAAEALSQVGPAGRHALGPLHRAMQSDDLELVYYASTSIVRLAIDQSEGIPGLLRLVKAKDHRRLQAIERMAGRVDGAEAIAVLSDAARTDPDAEVRREALKAIGGMRLSSVKSALSVFVEAIADRNEYVRDAAVETLVVYGPDVATLAVPKLVVLVKSSNSHVRGAAIKALSGMGRPAVQVLKEQGETTALSKIGAAAVPALVEMLKSGDEKSQLNAIWALREMIPAETTGALDELNRLAGKKNKALRCNAIMSLRRYIKARQSGVSLDALIDAANDFEDEEAQSNAIIAFGELGPLAKPAIPTLIGLARCKNRQVRFMTVHVFGHLGDAAGKEVVDVLIKSLDDDYDAVRTFALTSLKRLGPKAAAPAADRLEKVMRDEKSFNEDDRRTAEDLLDGIRQQSK